ncbi:MAG: MFS transporter [Delftia sp.]|nr:MFS transporter [Delftia sp.]
MGDYIGFMLSMTFASSTTVLPDFVSRLTDSEILVGLLSSLSSGAWLLPQLFFANLLSNKRRKKPYIMLGAAIGRPLFLVYAAALALGLYRHPALALGAFFAVQIIFFSSDALSAVGWFDAMSKAIPPERRGRLFGSSQFTGGILSIGAGLLITALLSDDGPDFPNNYAIILALSGVCLTFSLLSLGFMVEPDEPVQEQRLAWRDYLPQLLHTLRQDRTFTRLIAVQLLAGFDGLALGFYILFATQELGLPRETVGAFTSIQILSKIIASVGLGALAERTGSHRVIQVSTAFSLTAPLVGLALLLTGAQPGAMTAAICSLIFVVISVVISARMLGYYNYALSLAPAGQRPTYIGLFNTSSGLLIVLPTLGGWLLRVSSYGVLFAITAIVLVIAHALSLSLPSTRRAKAP